MKIGVISDVFYPYLKGGAEIRYYEIFSRLSLKHDVKVYLMQWYNSKKKEIHKNMKIYRFHKINNFYNQEGKREIFPSLLFSSMKIFMLSEFINFF